MSWRGLEADYSRRRCPRRSRGFRLRAIGAERCARGRLIDIRGSLSSTWTSIRSARRRRRRNTHRATVSKYYSAREVARIFRRNCLRYQLRNLTREGSMEALFREIALLNPSRTARHGPKTESYSPSLSVGDCITSVPRAAGGASPRMGLGL